jgi:hypothetical protein
MSSVSGLKVRSSLQLNNSMWIVAQTIAFFSEMHVQPEHCILILSSTANAFIKDLR